MNALAMAKNPGRPPIAESDKVEAEWLKEALYSVGMSQSDLAKALGVRPQNVSIWISSNRIPAKRVAEVQKFIADAKLSGGAPPIRTVVTGVDWLKVVSVLKIIQATHAETWEQLSDEERAELLEFAYSSIASENPGINAFLQAQK